MTQRQLLIVNVLVSFLPWVFPAGISLVMLLILGLISVYTWYIQRDYDQRTAYMTLVGMTLLTTFHFFLFDQLLSALYVVLLCMSFIVINLLSKQVQVAPEAIEIVAYKSTPTMDVARQEHELTRALMMQMDHYMEQVLRTMENVMQRTESSSNQKMAELHAMMENHSLHMRKDLEGLHGKIDRNADVTAEQSEAMMADLQTALRLHESKDETLQEVMELLKEKSSDGLDVETMRQIIQDLQLKDVKPMNRHYVENQQMKDLFYRAFDEAHSDICIVSPWLGNWLLRDKNLKNKIEAALKRGVDIKIVYGIGMDKGMRDDRAVTSEKVAKDLKNRWLKKGYPGKVKLHVSNTHFKLLMCDETYLVIGSYNFLSNQGKFGEAGSWHEAGEYAEDAERIRQLKEIHFSF